MDVAGEAQGQPPLPNVICDKSCIYAHSPFVSCYFITIHDYNFISAPATSLFLGVPIILSTRPIPACEPALFTTHLLQVSLTASHRHAV